MEIKSINVGIPTSHMDYFAAKQLGDQWCWAACIKMVLNYYGIAITQNQIVYRTYGTDEFGRLPDWPASYKTIHENLNNWSIDNNGNKYSVKAKFKTGIPNPKWLINEIIAKRPVIVTYKTGPTTGHAVLITGLSYKFYTNKLTISKIVVRDPWHSEDNIAKKGRNKYSGHFGNQIEAFWSIRVLVKD